MLKKERLSLANTGGLKNNEPLNPLTPCAACRDATAAAGQLVLKQESKLGASVLGRKVLVIFPTSDLHPKLERLIFEKRVCTM